MEWGNLRNWLGESPRSRDLRETREAWESVEELWLASPFAKRKTYEITNEFMSEACDEAERLPAVGILVPFAYAIDDLLRAEDVVALEPDLDDDSIPVRRPIRVAAPESGEPAGPVRASADEKLRELAMGK